MCYRLQVRNDSKLLKRNTRMRGKQYIGATFSFLKQMSTYVPCSHLVNIATLPTFQMTKNYHFRCSCTYARNKFELLLTVLLHISRNENKLFSNAQPHAEVRNGAKLQVHHDVAVLGHDKRMHRLNYSHLSR